MGLFDSPDSGNEQAGAAVGSVAIRAVPVIGQIPIISGFIGSKLGAIVGGIFGGKPSDNASGASVLFNNPNTIKREGDKSTSQTSELANQAAQYAGELISGYKSLGASFIQEELDSGIKVTVGTRDGLRVGGARLPTKNYGSNQEAFFGGIKERIEGAITNQEDVLNYYNNSIVPSQSDTDNSNDTSPYVTTQDSDDAYSRLQAQKDSGQSSILLIGSILTAIIAMRG